MNIKIESSGISLSKKVKSSISHATLAAKKCLANSKIKKNEVDLIIYMGLYRDNNIS